jgi:hypothetical protein
MGQVFQQSKQYLDQIDPGDFVEIGTSRGGDDGSTQVIASWARGRGNAMYTVDVDPTNCEYVREKNIPGLEIINTTGEEYFYKRIYGLRLISYLYLDNFDWDWHPEKTEAFVVEQQERYKSFGLDMTNVNSQSAHLHQMIMALPHMAECCLVVCDDTWYNKWWGHYSGKSGAVVPYLVGKGFQVLYTEEQPVYGTILGRGINQY